jgi:hypothetical protein
VRAEIDRFPRNPANGASSSPPLGADLSIVRTLVVGMALILASGCDPGMTIRQTTPQLRATNSAQITIRVLPTHPFVGTKLYAPTLQIANSSESSIAVVGIDLITQHGKFQNKSQRSGIFPFELPSGKTQELGAWFELSDSLKRAFSQSVELQVHCRAGGMDQTFRASLVGGGLDPSRH